MVGEPEDWLYGKDDVGFWQKCQTYPSKRFIENISGYVFGLFSNYIKKFSTDDFQKRICHFFFYVCGNTPMSRGQIFQVAILLKRLIEREQQDVELAKKRSMKNPEDVEVPAENSFLLDETGKNFEPIVTEGNLGTLLLCAIDIAGKVNEDVPFNNKYWSKLLQVDLGVVNTSEIVFLKRIHYDVAFNAEEVLCLAKSLNLY